MAITVKDVALKAGVEHLYLNHISARYLGQDVKELEKGAQSIFKQSKVVFDLEEYDLNSLN